MPINNPQDNKNPIKLTPAQIRHLVHSDIYSQITSQLQDALILNNLIFNRSGKYHIGEIAFDDDENLKEEKDLKDTLRDPVDVSWELSKIDILKTKDQLFRLVDQYGNMDEEEKKRIKSAIRDFICERFLAPQRELQKKRKAKTLEKDYFHYNQQLAAQKAQERGYSPAQQELYKNISHSISGILSKQNPDFIAQDGSVTSSGLKFIAKVFLRTIKHIHTLESSKGVHYIFHDGDFHFLRVENGDGSPKVATFDHYVRAIMYLMDQNGINPYGKNSEEGTREWNNSKNSFLNNLYKTLSYTEEPKKESFPDKESIHYNFAHEWEQIHEENNNKDAAANDNSGSSRIPVNRYKTEASRLSKLASKGNDSLTDESGLRSTFYGDSKDKEFIFDHIEKVSTEYLDKISRIPWVSISKISTVSKWGFISQDQENDLIERFRGFFAHKDEDRIPEIKKREKKSGSIDYFPLIEQISESSLQTKIPPAQKHAYELASGKISRGSNGDYQDFKLVVQIDIDKEAYQESPQLYPLINDPTHKWESKISLFQEISFYPFDNDLNIGNHHFLDLEKKIDTRVSNMNDPKLGKSISLDRLRRFVETTIKDISFDIDMYEEKVAKGILVNPRNDNYKYLEINGERISLKNLISRNENNSERFDHIICYVLNYFIKENKLLYINTDNVHHFGFITPKMLHEENGTKGRRFTIPKLLKNIALTSQNENKNEMKSFTFYHQWAESNMENFETVQFNDLNKLCKLENTIKKNKR